MVDRPPQARYCATCATARKAQSSDSWYASPDARKLGRRISRLHAQGHTLIACFRKVRPESRATDASAEVIASRLLRLAKGEG